jgi:hypothetical protein
VGCTVSNGHASQRAVWKGLTFRELLAAAMVDRPQAQLMVDIGLDGKAVPFTARTLDHLATRIARRFSTAGAKQGDVILIALPNGVAAFLAMLGALGAGLRPCLVPPTLDYASIPVLLQRIKPRALVSAAYPAFDPLSAFVNEARRLAMPLYLWNFGPADNDHSAPLSDLLDAEAPKRLLPLHPPFSGEGTVLTVTDLGDGPEAVEHRQDHLLAQAVLARMAERTAPPARLISAVSLATQAGLVLGPMRALLTGAELTLISDPSATTLARASASGPAEWILPLSLAARLRETGLAEKRGPVTTLYRAGKQMHNPLDERGFLAFGEALTLPMMRHGKALAPGVIGTATDDGPLHFATLATQNDGTLLLDSPLLGRLGNGKSAIPPLLATVGPDGRFTRFINRAQGAPHG